MENSDFITTIKDSFYDLADVAISFVPRLITALLLIVLGLVIARVAANLVKKGLGILENNSLIQGFFDGLGVKMMHISDIASMFVRYAVLLIFVSAAVGVLELEVLSNTFESILEFIPKIFAAVVVAGVALIASNVVRTIVDESAQKAGVGAHSMLANIARIAVLVFGFPLAATQLGLDLTIINNNITVVMAGVMLAFAIAFGFGGRDTAAKIVDDAYSNFKK